MSKYEIIKDKPLPKNFISKRQELSEAFEKMEIGDCILLSQDEKELRAERQHISRNYKDNKNFGYIIRKTNKTDTYCWKISRDDDRFYENNKRVSNSVKSYRRSNKKSYQ